MNDTNNMILAVFTKDRALSSSDAHALLSGKISLVTVKRALTELRVRGLLDRSGGGRSISYQLTRKGLLLRPFDTEQYLKQDQEKRIVEKGFNHDLLRLPPVPVLDETELAALTIATDKFHSRGKHNEGVAKKELERFIVEMSWKSARMEGNTYTLLDTEQLLLHGVKSPKNTEFETQMILNQKAAFDFVYEHKNTWHRPTVAAIEKVHELIITGLGVKRNLRSSGVGITGTEYVPLGNAFQIREALDNLLVYVEQLSNVYEKALMLVMGISYIQPFADGNKRTSRMVANALLLAEGYAPISYRAVDETVYKEACLLFYEQNSLVAFKQLFVDQYIYSATHYNIA